MEALKLAIEELEQRIAPDSINGVPGESNGNPGNEVSNGAGSCRPSGGKAQGITIRHEHSRRSSAPQRAACPPIHPSCGA
jgi:hypothetical protein